MIIDHIKHYYFNVKIMFKWKNKRVFQIKTYITNTNTVEGVITLGLA